MSCSFKVFWLSAYPFVSQELRFQYASTGVWRVEAGSMQEGMCVCFLEIHFCIQSAFLEKVGSFVGYGIQEVYFRAIYFVRQVDGGMVVI